MNEFHVELASLSTQKDTALRENAVMKVENVGLSLKLADTHEEILRLRVQNAELQKNTEITLL